MAVSVYVLAEVRALAAAEVAKVCVASRAVLGIPCTFVVTELWVDIADDTEEFVARTDVSAIPCTSVVSLL